MRIAICGCGVVGRATGEGFARLGHEVYTYDINPDAARVPWGTPLERPDLSFRSDLVFICTPEEVAEEVALTWPGTCDFIVVRSSTTPGTVLKLYDQHGRLAIHNPEFLREATALQDFLNPSYILLGIPDRGRGVWLKVEHVLTQLYEPFRAPLIVTDPTTSEIVKLATNVVLYMHITTWNAISVIAGRLGISSHQVGMIASKDPRIPPYGANKHGEPPGGRCLPKDIRTFIKLAGSLGMTAPLFQAAEDFNAKLQSGLTGTSPTP